jgi:superfamily II DNA or RNA helicase
MQKLPQPTLVLVRKRRWRIAGVRALGDHDLVTLSGAEAVNHAITRRVLTPFDTIDPVHTPSSPVRVGIRRWRRACRALIADAAPPGALRAARYAQIEVLPHQLEPALAIAAGAGTRLLLADDVGLGKTVQAALVLAELAARHAVERVLVLTPAGLRDQWRDELHRRVGVVAAIADTADIGRRMADLPPGVNPWQTIPVAIASMDYVKRPEVLPAVAAAHWDLVIVDEAHNVAGASDRHDAAAALAARAAYVVLVTATPHNGDRRAFQSLCALGAAGDDDDPLLLFRRTRRDVHVGPRRRIHRVNVRSTPAESRMHGLLERFLRAVVRERGDRVHLAASTLRKRAFSSAHSLRLSVSRRLATLDASCKGAVEQLALPLGDGGGEFDTSDDMPAWHEDLQLADSKRERRLLTQLGEAAAAASGAESKIAALRRLLRRVDEPVLIFTEYRDTLHHIRASLACSSLVLHGALRRDERSDALRAFTQGEARVLVATDAAGEGLNLQQSCRIVVTFELPWNPMRLEQRIGRVDRIGQTRPVHAFHLVGHDTAETLVFERLQRRIAIARRDAGAADPVGDAEERAVARLVATRTEADEEETHDSDVPRSALAPDLALEGVCEAARLTTVRRYTDAAGEGHRLLLETSAGWFACTRSSATRTHLRGRMLIVYAVALEDGLGRVAAFTIVPLLVTWPDGSARQRARDVGRSEALARTAAAAARRWIDDATAAHAAFMRARCARARAIEHAVPHTLARHQMGLFDRRAAQAIDAMASRDRDLSERHHTQLAALERASAIHAPEPRLLLILAPRP